MGKAKAIDAVRKYGKEYTDTVIKINKIRKDNELSEDGKAVRIASIADAYNAKSESLRNGAVSAIGEIKSAMDLRRQEAITRGMQSAEQINMVVSGINSNAYSLQMINDIISSFSDNPVGLETIRGALLNNDREAYKSAGVTIPMNTDAKVCKNLDSIIDQINHEPSVTNTDKSDWNIGLFQSGQTFDSWCDYISENVNLADD